MNKENFLRLYSKISIFIGVLLFIFVIFFVSSFPLATKYPTGFRALIETNVFTITLVNYSANITLMNTPLIVFMTLLILNIVMLIRVGDTKNIDEKPLQTVVFNNIIITMMLIIGQIAFVLMIPENINGIVQNRFLFVTFHSGTGTPVHVILASYVLTLVYIGYNIMVVNKTKPEVVEEDSDIISTVKSIDQTEEQNN